MSFLSSLGCAFSGPRYHGPASDHFDGKRFFTPGAPPPHGFRDVLKWALHRDPGPWREWTYAPPGPKPPERVGPGQMRVTFVNHATVLVQMDGLNILTDPIWSERCSPVSFLGPKRVRPPGIRFEDLPPIDVVVISHNHYDHLDLPTLKRLRDAFDPRFLVGLGNAELLADQGLPRVQELDWWQSSALGNGVSATAVPAQHFSNRGIADQRATLWTGWVLQGSSGYAFFAGDTGYGPHFEAIRRRLGEPRLAILPIGAFRPEWFMAPVHMSPSEALMAHHDLGAVRSVAMHFGTFHLADDGQHEAPVALKEGGDDTFWVLDFGEGRDVPPTRSDRP